MTVIEKLFNWIYYFIKLSMIYLVLLFSGLLILGFSPANATLLTLFKAYKSDTEKYTFSEAFKEFKHCFISSNLVLGILLLIGTCLSYSMWGLSHMKAGVLIYFFLMINLICLVFLVALYAVYLKLQAYYDLALSEAMKLSGIALFFNWMSIFKWLLGTSIALILLSKLPLMLMIFLPIFWLIFTFDVLEPIYQKVAEWGNL